MSEDKHTIVPPKKLQDKLAEHLKETGQLSSSDVSAFQRGSQPEAEENKDPGEALHQNTELNTSKDKDKDGMDPLVKAGQQSDASDTLKDGSNQTDSMDSNPLMNTIERRANLNITPEDKEAFITAAIHNKRMTLTYSLMGGRITVRVRSRLVAETRAIIARERWEIENKMVDNRMDHTIRLRSMLMTAQIAEFNGQSYNELEEPLMPQVGAEGAETAPAWVTRIDHWAGQSDAVHAMLWGCIQDFEDKYWRMIEDAQNADFWQPVASTSE